MKILTILFGAFLILEVIFYLLDRELDQIEAERNEERHGGHADS